MKKNSLLIVLSLCITSVFAQEWKKVCKDTMSTFIIQSSFIAHNNRMVVTSKQIYSSINNGKNFKEIKLPVKLNSVSTVAFDKDTMYIAHDTNIYKELPDGKLLKISYPSLSTIYCMMYLDKELIVGTHDEGIWVMLANGKWEQRGLKDKKQLERLWSNNGVIFTQTSVTDDLFRSTDKGKTWVILDKDIISDRIGIYNNKLYAWRFNSSNKLSKIAISSDNGSTFDTQIDAPLDGTGLSFFTVVKDTIYATTITDDTQLDSKIIKYDAKTQTWIELKNGKPKGLIFNLTHDNNGKLFAVIGIEKPAFENKVQVIEYQLFGTSANNEVALPENALKAYPNPFSNSINIQCSPDLQLPAQLTLFNTEGSIVQKEHILNNQTEINTEKLPKGMYFIKLKTADQKTTQTKMIKY